MKYMFSIAGMALLIGVGAAAAQQSTSLHEGHLDQLDRNDDGAVSRDEYRTFMTNAYSRLDANGDGSLTQDEASSVLSPDQFTAVDANGDGSASQQEFMDQVMRDFQTADRTGDGQLR